MDINQILQTEINNLADLEKEIVYYIFKELENDRYMSLSTIEDKVLEQIDQRLGGE